MTIDLRGVRLLEETTVKKGDRWIYVADLNIDHDGTDLKSMDRIDAEIDDLKQIRKSGGIAVILAHKGRFEDKDTEDLDFVLPYLKKRLGGEPQYFPARTTKAARDFVNGPKPGDVAIMGNTRKHKGEEENSARLAKQFAKLGDFVAVGGFGKAHRAHASNVGILDYLPGYATRSQTREMASLSKWAGRNEKTYLVAVLGGVKKEKITVGLAGFAEMYDAIIPGGIVLNTLLKAKGYRIGDSLKRDGGRTFIREARAVLRGPHQDKICLPEKVIVATVKEFGNVHTIKVSDGVPRGYMIVDYLMPRKAVTALDKVVRRKGRLVLAGTPGIYTQGFARATDAVMKRMKRRGVKGLVLGGDTAGEVGYKGTVSTGGGSALYFVAYGTTAVLEALRANGGVRLIPPDPASMARRHRHPASW